MISLLLVSMLILPACVNRNAAVAQTPSSSLPAQSGSVGAEQPSSTAPIPQALLPLHIESFYTFKEGTLYQSDFASGTDGWRLEADWALQKEGGKNVLGGAGHQWAVYEPSQEWTDYTLTFDFKLKGGTHFNIRWGDGTRYFIALHEEGYQLHKQLGEEYTQLFSGPASGLRNSWHKMTIEALSNEIKVRIDDDLLMNYTDRENPIYQGGFAFECLDNSQLWIDNVKAQGPIATQRNAWKKTGGPLGGLGYDVRIDPQNKSTMFVTDNPSGVNKSTDGGATWFQSNAGIMARTGSSSDSIPIFSLTIDPNDSNIVWCGMQATRGIFKSKDGGKSWVKKDNGIVEQEEITIRGFAVKPGDSNVVFLGAEIDQGLMGKEFARQKGKIYKSTDGGENWKCVWEGGSLARIVLFDPTNPNILYASTGIFDREAFNEVGEGVLKSTDGGNTWENINNGLENLFVGFLEMHPTDPNTLICAAGNNISYSGGGVYITHNGGQSWERVLNEIDHYGMSMTVAAFSPSNPSILYAGDNAAFYRSENSGRTWQRFSKEEEGAYGPPGVRAGFPISVAVDPSDPYTLFANNYGGGVFKSIDGAQTWIESSKGYTGADIKKVSVSSTDQNKVFAIGRSGPFVSSNGGESWSGLAYSPLTHPEWYNIVVCPSDNQLVLCSDEFDGAIFRSIDGGKSWKQVITRNNGGGGDPSNRHGFKAIEFAPSNAKIVYAGMCKNTGAIDGNAYRGPSFGMFKSQDGGETWVEINAGLENADKNINCIAVHPSDENIVYIGTFQDGAFKSTDGGKSWTAISNGLMSEDVRSLAINPANPDVVYAGLGNGVGLYMTTDGGQSWSPACSGIVVECPSYLQRIGQVNPGVSLEKPVRTVGIDYVSTPWTVINSVVILPSNPNILFVSDYQRGVYMSTTGGQAWVAINEGLDFKAVTSLSLSGNEAVLYASTSGGGVYRLELGEEAA